MEPLSEANTSTLHADEDAPGTDNLLHASPEPKTPNGATLSLSPPPSAQDDDPVQLALPVPKTSSGATLSPPPPMFAQDDDPAQLSAFTATPGYETPLEPNGTQVTPPCMTPVNGHTSDSSSMEDPNAPRCSKPRKKVTDCFFGNTPSHYDFSPDQLTPRRRRNHKILLVDTECSTRDVRNALGEDVCGNCSVTLCDDYYSSRSLYLVQCNDPSIVPLAASQLDMAMLPYVTHADWYVCVTDYGCIQDLYRVALADRMILPYVRVCSYDRTSNMAHIGKPETGLPTSGDLLLRMMVWSQKKANAVHAALGSLVEHDFCGPYVYNEASGGQYTDLFQGLVQAHYGKKNSGRNAAAQKSRMNPDQHVPATLALQGEQQGAPWWSDEEWRSWSSAHQHYYQYHSNKEAQAIQDRLTAMHAAILRPAVREDEAQHAQVQNLQHRSWPYGKGWPDQAQEAEDMRAWLQQQNLHSDFGPPSSMYFGNQEAQYGNLAEASVRAHTTQGVMNPEMYPPMDYSIQRAHSMSYPPTSMQYTPTYAPGKGASFWKQRQESSEYTKWQRPPARYSQRSSKGSTTEDTTKKRNPHHPIPPIGSGFKGHKGERQIVCMNPFYLEQVAAIVARKDQKGFGAKGKKGFDAKGGHEGFDAKGGHEGFDAKGGRKGYDAKGGYKGFEAKGGYKGFDAKGGHKGFGAGRGEWHTGKGWKYWDSSAEGHHRNDTPSNKSGWKKGKGSKTRQWKQDGESNEKEVDNDRS